MAKRKSRSSALNITAETIGSTLGRVAARMEALNRQRAVLLKEVAAVANAAQVMLRDLGHSAQRGIQEGRKGGRPKGYKMSAATKAKLRAAWKKRKAASGK